MASDLGLHCLPMRLLRNFSYEWVKEMVLLPGSSILPARAYSKTELKESLTLKLNPFSQICHKESQQSFVLAALKLCFAFKAPKKANNKIYVCKFFMPPNAHNDFCKVAQTTCSSWHRADNCNSNRHSIKNSNTARFSRMGVDIVMK